MEARLVIVDFIDVGELFKEHLRLQKCGTPQQDVISVERGQMSETNLPITTEILK